MKPRAGITGKLLMSLLTITMLFSMMGLSTILPAKTALAYTSAPSDSQEATIKHVLAEAGAEFGWDQSFCFYGTPAYEGAEAPYYCPEIWGPRAQYGSQGGELKIIEGVAAYGLDVPISEQGTVWQSLPMKIQAFTTEAAAEASIAKSIATVSSSSMAGFEVTTFHNHPAIVSDISSLGGTDIDWQAGRFLFYAGLSVDIGISHEEIAEALYAKAVKYGLVTDEGGTVLIQDSDGDGVTDDIDQCPGTPTGVTVDSSGCPLEEGISLSLTTDKKAYSAGETVVIQGAVSDVQGKLAGAAVAVDVSGTQFSATTDSSGNYRCEFPIPADATQAVYTVSATASYSGYPSVSNSTTFIVGDIGLLVEINPATGESFIGVTADGVSSLGMSISLPGFSDVKISQPDLGRLEGNAIGATGNITLDSAGMAEITYYPPDYLTTSQLTREEVGVHQSGSRVWAAEVPLTLTYTDTSDQEGKIEAEILVCRPPVMLVHGFLGATATWGKMSSYLQGEKFDTYLGNYGATDQSIEGLAVILKNDIRKQKSDYANSNIKITKVDAVGHSMGGLISRYYSHGLTNYDGDLRKLIMVGTPNHGVSWTKKITGNVGAGWYQTHRIPAEQLYSESPFMKALNSGEAAGAQLNPDIQYGNIYGFPDDWVVSSASAYLNGVASVTEADVKHSPDIPGVPYVAITEYLNVWGQVNTWLTSDIYRPPLKGSHVEVFKYWGDVYQVTYDASGGHETKITAVPTRIDTFQSLRTGPDSKAILHLTINDTPWGVIFLDPDSEIFLGYISPQLVEVRLWQGSASFRSKEDGHFTVPVNIKRSQDGEWWTYSPNAVVTGLNTEFAVAAGDNIEIHCLEGELVVDTPESTGAGTTVSADNSVAVNGESVSAINPAAEDDFWWSTEDDDFLDSAPGGSWFDKFKSLWDSFINWVKSLFS